jgi:diguanylate cyclase (GGDEF)-like protein
MNAMGVRPIKVLLIEDNPGDARLIREALAQARDAPIDLEHADRLATGLERLSSGGIDIILLDLSLPDSQGLDTFLEAHTQAPGVPIVVLSGLDDEGLAVKAVRQGAQDYLVKGQVDTHLLVRALRYAIERYRMQVALRSLSLIDDLTGLFNDGGFLSLAEHHLKLAHRTKMALLLVYANLDNLKQISEAFGHQEGDQALIKTAEILRETFGQLDIIARMIGDEFGVLARAASSGSDKNIPARLQETLKMHNAEKRTPYALSLSVGVACFDPLNPSSIGDLMAKAKEALYEQVRAKQRS